MSFCKELPDGTHLWGRSNSQKTPWKLYRKIHGGLLELDTFGVQGAIPFKAIDQWETVFPPADSPEAESIIFIRQELFIIRPDKAGVSMRHYLRGEAGFLWGSGAALFSSIETALNAILTQDYCMGMEAK